MTRTNSKKLVAGVLIVLLTGLGHTREVGAVPSGFQNEILITGLDQPTALVFLPDRRMLITRKNGVIDVVQPGATAVDPTQFLEITNINTGDPSIGGER